jgi:release factor glutamine methyltransferase
VTDLVDRLRAAGCVFAEDEARLLTAAADSPGDLEVLVQRRLSGQPLEHVLGWAEFCGVRIAVASGVFVPRPRTERLVRLAVPLVRGDSVLVDLCTGSGAIAVAIAARVRPGEVHAVDLDPAAVACARHNLAELGTVHCGSLFEPLPARLRGSIGILTVNAPYVPTDELPFLPREARQHEPVAALDGGGDGLDVYRHVLAQAGSWLAVDGHALMEVAVGQAAKISRLARRAGLAVTVRRSRTAGTSIVLARRPAP